MLLVENLTLELSKTNQSRLHVLAKNKYVLVSYSLILVPYILAYLNNKWVNKNYIQLFCMTFFSVFHKRQQNCDNLESVKNLINIRDKIQDITLSFVFIIYYYI